VRIASLGSGSRGNAFLVASESTRLLVDAGFSASRLARRLGTLGVDPEEIDAVVITHEHRDHTAGMGIAARRWKWPLFMTRRTRTASARLLDGSEDVRTVETDRPFRIGELEVRPVPTCHDAAEPMAVTVREATGGLELGIATDLGRATVPVRHALARCHFLVLEANHDENLLRQGPYPWAVKQRIGGSRGHLSNRLAAELAAELAGPRLCGLLLAHLSEACNEPDLALERVEDALAPNGYRGVLEVAEQDRPTPFYSLRALLDEMADGPQLRLFGC